ncbi:MAG TPA: hypothetical protein VK095_13350 [Beutenbergiaceae bacterium]|nr:hypothetical protein [Beutenbergiaceae bacterium]
MSLRSTRKYLKRRGIHQGLVCTLIADRALARSIEIAPDDQQRLSMRVGNRRVWFNGARSNLNSALARRCVLHKDVTSRLLRSYGLSAPDNIAFAPGQAEAAWAWAEQVAPVVVKPTDGGLGNLVHLNITDAGEFQRAFDAVARAGESVLVERFVDGVEHRVMVVYGKVVAAARRDPANIVGDGRSSVIESIRAKNKLRVRSKNPVHWELPIDEDGLRELTRQGLNWDSVPADGQRVWLRSNSNVHSGGDGVDVTDELTPEEIRLAERVTRAIPGLKLVGLDMLLPRGGKGSEPFILEVNGSPMITGHHYPWVGQPRDVAGMLIDAMFPQHTSGN